MAIIFLGKESFPTYMALSTDVTTGCAVGLSIMGGTVYTTDDQKWYIIYDTSGSRGVIESFKMPALET